MEPVKVPMSQQERSSEVSVWLDTPIEQITPEQLKELDDMVLSEEGLEEPESADPTETFSTDKAKSAAGQDRPSIRDQGPQGSFAFHTSTSVDTVSLPMPQTHVQTSARDVHTPDAPASSQDRQHCWSCSRCHTSLSCNTGRKAKQPDTRYTCTTNGCHIHAISCRLREHVCAHHGDARSTTL